MMTNFDVTKNTALTDLDCYNNRFTGEGLNALFGILHANAGSKIIYIGNNPGTSGSSWSIAEAKVWTVNFMINRN